MDKNFVKNLIGFLLIMLVGVSFSSESSDNLEFGDIEETTFWDDWQVIKDRVLGDAGEAMVEARPAAAVYGGAWSRHIGKNRHGMNEVHELIAFEYDGWVLGHMKNSFNDSTWLFGRDFNLISNDYIGFGVIGGVTYGYDPDDISKEFQFLNWNKWMITPAPYLEFNYFTKHYGWNPRLVVFGNAVAFTMRYQF